MVGLIALVVYVGTYNLLICTYIGVVRVKSVKAEIYNSQIDNIFVLIEVVDSMCVMNLIFFIFLSSATSIFFQTVV